MVTRLIANGSPEAKSAGCLAALKKEKDKMVARQVWDESAVDEWANVRKNGKDAPVGRIFSIMGEKHAERRLLEADRGLQGQDRLRGQQHPDRFWRSPT